MRRPFGADRWWLSEVQEWGQLALVYTVLGLVGLECMAYVGHPFTARYTNNLPLQPEKKPN